MAAPKGNRFAVDLENFRKPKAYTPDQWSDVFVKYLESIEDKVWNKKEAIKSGDMVGKLIDVPTVSPPTIRAFCVFANVSHQTFLNYESREGYDEYFELTTRMRDVIESAQLEGALVMAYSQNIVARLQGLADKKEIKGKMDMGRPDLSNLSKEELLAMREMLKKGASKDAD